MTQHKGRMTPLQFYKIAIDSLGAGRVKNILQVHNIRTLQRWTADPLCTSEDSQSASQMERHRNLFEKMDQIGLGYACRGMLCYLESALSGTGCPEAIANVQDTMSQEQLLDHKRVAELHAAIDAGLSVTRVQEIERETVEEVQRTVAKYIRDQDNG